LSRYVSDWFSLLVFDTFPLCFEPLLGCMLIFFPPPLHTPTHIRVCNYTLQLTRCLDEARDGTTVGASGGLMTPSPTYENSGGIVETQHNVQLAQAQPMHTPQTQPLRSSLCEFAKTTPADFQTQVVRFVQRDRFGLCLFFRWTRPRHPAAHFLPYLMAQWRNVSWA